MKFSLAAVLCIVLSAQCFSQCPSPGSSCTNSVNSGTINSLTGTSVICITGGNVTIDGNIPNGAKIYVSSSATLNLQNTNVFEGTIYNCGTFNQGNSNIGGAASIINNYGTANLSNNGITLGSGDIINNYSGGIINIPGNLLMDMGAKINNSGLINQSNVGASVNIKSGAEFTNMQGSNVTTIGNFTVESGGKADNFGLIVAHKDININTGSLVYNKCTFHSYTKIIIATSLINDGLLLCDDPGISNPGPGLEKIEINGSATLTNNKTVVGSEFLNSGIVTGNNGWFYFLNITTNSALAGNFSGTNLTFYDATSTGSILDNGIAGTGVVRTSFALPTLSQMTNNCGNIFGNLPIKLKTFSAAPYKNDGVILSWQVENGFEKGHYEIERSIDGNRFYNASAITTADKNIEQILNNETQFSNKLYYRLKITDLAGTVTYSNIVFVDLKNTSKSTVSIYPNPVSSRLYVSSLAPNYVIEIYNTESILINSITVENTMNYSIDFGKEAKGLYFVKFKYKDGSSEMRKIVKL